MAAQLVGRADELGALRRAMAEALDGHGSTAVVAGDAGMGKSFLLGVLRDEAVELGARVLLGRAPEFESLPFGVFLDALDDHLRSVDRAVLERLDPDERAELALIFPSLRGLAHDERRAAGVEDRARGYLATRRLLELLAEREPLVLVLDDLHWADRSSLELFDFLLRRPVQGRVLLVGAYRPFQIEPTLADDVVKATQEGLARYLELAPLDVAGSAELIGIDDPVAAAELHRATGGNPYFLLALADAGATASAPDAELPPTIARAVTSDLARVSDTARTLAEVAAVAGDPFDLDLAVGTAGLTAEAGYAAIDELVACRIVVAGDAPREFAFRHPLVRQAIYGTIPPGRRLAVHERCAAVLAERGAAPTELAHHVEHAGRAGDRVAVALLAEAAAAVAPRAPATAVRWLRAARRLLPDAATRQEKLALVTPLSALLTTLGHPEAAHEAMLECLALADDVDEHIAFSLACATLEQGLGRYEDARRRLADALASLPESGGEQAVSVMIAMVMDGFYANDRAAIRRWAGRAVDLARREHRPVLEAAANAASALAHALAGSTAEAELRLDAALELLPGLDDDELAQRLDVLGAIVGAELYLDRYEACAEHAARGIALGRAAGTLASAPTLQPSYGTALWVLGRFAESIAHLDAAVESARAARHPQGIAWMLFNLAYAQAMSGEIPAALANSHESLALAERHDDSVIASWAGAVAGLAEFESGQPERALATMDRTLGGPHYPNVPGGWRNLPFDTAVRAHLALGQLDEAERAAAEALSWASAVGLPYPRALALRSSASCALARGDLDRAATEALAGAAVADSISARVDAARCRIVAGSALARSGATERAAQLLGEAAAHLDSCGSTRFRGEAERELGRLGRRPHRRTSPGTAGPGVGSLTAREREIADHVVLRHSNPEIAALMFLSPKTVETHLRNIFRKLGVSSRADVARAVEASARSTVSPS